MHYCSPYQAIIRSGFDQQVTLRFASGAMLLRQLDCTCWHRMCTNDKDRLKRKPHDCTMSKTSAHGQWSRTSADDLYQ